MNLEGSPNRTERGEAFSWSGHDMPMRFNLDHIHEEEFYHSAPPLSRLQKPEPDREAFPKTSFLEKLPRVQFLGVCRE